MDIAQQRNEAVVGTIAEIRAIEQAQGVTPAALEAIKGVLLKLAARRELFPEDHFPVGADDGNGVVYRLSEDDDHRFALYASTALPGKDVYPHNHTTWAVIVGVHGDERNIFYERTDDGAKQGIGQVRQTKKFTVSFGNGVTLMPEDIHSIHVTGGQKTVHLHMYGLALEQLHERVMYNTQAGTYKVFPATQNIKQA
ncbi:MAG: cysteine dioxygenase [Rhodospirillales bacterium]|nr:cysteine dioxygenase [Rhodospirillales bacterium]